MQERDKASRTESTPGVVLTWKRRGGWRSRRRAQGVPQSQQMLEAGDDSSRVGGHTSLRRWWGEGGGGARRVVDVEVLPATAVEGSPQVVAAVLRSSTLRLLPSAATLAASGSGRCGLRHRLHGCGVRWRSFLLVGVLVDVDVFVTVVVVNFVRLVTN